MDAFNTDNLGTAMLDEAEAETLSGDIRDALLTHVRAIRVPWAMLAEDDQREVIEAITKTAEHAVRTCANLMAQQGFPHLSVRLGKWTVKDGVKIEVTAQSSVDNITQLAEHGTGTATLVLCEAADWIGERAPAKPDPNQRDLLDDEAA